MSLPSRHLFGLVVLVFLIPSCAQQGGNGGDAGLTPEVLAQNLETPWSMDFLPGGAILVTERSGRLSVLEQGERRVLGEVQVVERSEDGLLGVAVDPDFSTNRHIYLYYTRTPSENRISRFELKDSIGSETVVLDGIPADRIHNGGRLRFGPDGMLYATTGDAARPELSQDTSSLAGKVLRMNPDGSIPADNPFGNLVWSLGHRNPQGMDWDPQNGSLYVAEHGPNRRDEVNLIVPGGNYGWPEETCDQVERFLPALSCYADFTLAPSGLAFHKGSLYVAGLRGNQLRRLNLSPSGDSVIIEQALFGDLGRLREVRSHDGDLYMSTSNRDGRGSPAGNDDRIFRLVSDLEGAASSSTPTAPNPIQLQ